MDCADCLAADFSEVATMEGATLENSIMTSIQLPKKISGLRTKGAHSINEETRALLIEGGAIVDDIV